MRKIESGYTVKVWISAKETYDWAHKPGARWPCSQLAGKHIFAEFQRGDLVDVTVNGRTEFEGDGAEFSAIITDFCGCNRPGDTDNVVSR